MGQKSSKAALTLSRLAKFWFFLTSITVFLSYLVDIGRYLMFLLIPIVSFYYVIIKLIILVSDLY
jgi:hypothetical protein